LGAFFSCSNQDCGLVPRSRSQLGAFMEGSGEGAGRESKCGATEQTN